MCSLKRWCVGVVFIFMFATAAAVVRADDQEPGGDDSPVVRQPVVKEVKPPAKPARVAPVKPTMTGTLLDPGLMALQLDEQTKGKVNDALAAWKTKDQEERAKVMAQSKEYAEKIKAETDKEKIKALRQEMSKLPKGPTDAERYKSARASVAEVLTEEQLATVDEHAKKALVEGGLKYFDGGVANLAKAGVELDDDQKEKVAAERAKLQGELEKIELGARNMSFGASMASLNAVRKNVLTDEQRGKLVPPKKEPPKEREKPVSED